MDEEFFTDHELKLTTYARRVRHVKALSIKSLSYKCSDVNHLEVYFTFHANATSAEFYKSDPVRGTINLSWNSIDLRHVPYLYTAPTVIFLRVWVQDGKLNPKVHLEYDLDLQTLVLSSPTHNSVGEVDGASEERAVTDVITFDMFGAKFELPSNTDSLPEYLYVETDQTPKCSYSSNQLARLQTVLRALKQTEQSTVRVKEDINRRMKERKPLSDKQERIESCSVSIASIKAKLEQKREILLVKKSRVAARRSETNRQEKEMEENQKSMQYDDMHYTDVKSDYYSAREKLLKGNALLSQRNKQMVHELCHIYPIEQMVDGRYTIAGVYLPGVEQVSSQTELASSTALGYTAHLISMLYRFLELPLQFPIEFRGSRSLIYDMVRLGPVLPSQKDRSFPLYSRGKDKRLFYYASQLLNQNIENLRHAYELPTKDSKLTLRNIKDFLHSKFGVGLVTLGQQESRSPPMPIQRTVSVPGVRHPSLAALGRTQTSNSAWSSPATDSPSEEYFSDETSAKPVTQPPAQSHSYQYDTTDSSKLASNDTLPVDASIGSNSPHLIRPPTDSIPFDTSDTSQQLEYTVDDSLTLGITNDIVDTDQQVLEANAQSISNEKSSGVNDVIYHQSLSDELVSEEDDVKIHLNKSVAVCNQPMTASLSSDGKDAAQEEQNDSNDDNRSVGPAINVNGVDKHKLNGQIGVNDVSLDVRMPFDAQPEGAVFLEKKTESESHTKPNSL